MATKKDNNLTLGYGCISCGHNKDINLYKDMYRMSTEKNAEHAREGEEFLKELKNNPPKRTRCRFYDSKDGLLCEYFVERDFIHDGTELCPDYLEVKFEKAPTPRKTTVVETEPMEEEDTSDMREVTDEENVDDEPLELDDDEE